MLLNHLTEWNIAVSSGLVILIWLVQLIIYPSLNNIPPDEFSRYHKWYVQRITVIVLPLMLAEMILAILWFNNNIHNLNSLLCLFLIGLIWLSTMAIQVPLHKKLQQRKDKQMIHQLVRSNWIRTLAWTAKALLVLAS
jgi:hypothetical protein